MIKIFYSKLLFQINIYKKIGGIKYNQYQFKIIF